jgi:pterin-4a-carbinolamine dehydratase
MTDFILHDYNFSVLADDECKSITENEKTMNKDEIYEAMKMAFTNKSDRKKRWEVIEFDNIQTLRGKFVLGENQETSYEETFSFIWVIYQIAIGQNYYPDITFGNGYAYISLCTTKLGGLHRNDFIMMAKVDSLIKDSSQI